MRKEPEAVAAAALFRHQPHNAWTQHSIELGETKNLGQWKARCLAVQTPSETALACRTPNDVGRLLALAFMLATSNVVIADLKSTDYFAPVKVRGSLNL